MAKETNLLASKILQNTHGDYGQGNQLFCNYEYVENIYCLRPKNVNVSVSIY